MTWQRIDENTYIDDTLVTCAEYQLFIDEMREQEIHYQPDHWILYKFPEGKAREPILGVRSTDAEDFCEWLTNREAGRWHYRLPTKLEVTKYPMQQTLTQSARGYWMKQMDDNSNLAWIGSTP